MGLGRSRPQDHLNDKARSEVIRLIALDATFNSFTDACTWPDHPRKRAEEHFINVGRSVHTITVAVTSAPGAFLEGQCLRMADYVRGRRPPGRRIMLMLPTLSNGLEEQGHNPLSASQMLARMEQLRNVAH